MTLRHQQLIASLKRATTFSLLSLDSLDRLAGGTTEIEFRRGNVVFSRGTSPTGIHVAASGQLKLTLDTRHGVEHVVELVPQCASFGEAALLSNRPHLVTAIAVTDCKVLHIGRRTVIAELERDKEFTRRMIGALSDRLYRQTSEMENVLFLKATGRVARFILDCLTSMGAENGRCVTLPAKKGLIASQLNMTQEHFSRTLRELTTSGLIKVNGTIVDVIEYEKLRDMAGLMVAPGNAEASARI